MRYYIDFETTPIQPRPAYPPKPVGLAVCSDTEQPKYLAFAHSRDNNASCDDAIAELRRIQQSGCEVVMHNAKFDLAVARTLLPDFLINQPHRVHDTMFLCFLDAPDEKAGLKETAVRLFGKGAEQQSDLAAYIWDNRDQLKAIVGEDITGRYGKANNAGKYYWACPGDVVAPYAMQDVALTRDVFRRLAPSIIRRGMLEAYNRERRLLPILMANEDGGIRCGVTALETDMAAYTAAFNRVEDTLRHALMAPELNFDADVDVAESLIRANLVQRNAFARTKTGRLSVSKGSMTPDLFTQPEIAYLLGYRNRLQTCMSMFMQPWLAQARHDGRVRTSWRQVGDARGGTRTGRPATSEPNFLNIPKNFEGRSDGWQHPSSLDLPRLPRLRRYLLPDEGHVWLHRDFSGQEVRVFAHYESGSLLKAYQDNPELDPHTWIQDEIKAKTGHELERTRVKNVTFARLYGGGIEAVYKQAKCSTLMEAREIVAFHDAALPGRADLNRALLDAAASGRPVSTWGGRQYKAQVGVEYRLLNTLVQGSAADLTKQCIIEFESDKGAGVRMLNTVYDEINITAPIETAKEEMRKLKQVMEADRLECPMRTDGKWGPNWGSLEKYDDAS